MASVLRSVQGPGVRPITGRHTGSTILPETKAFRDHVQSNGGEIEDGALRDLYDPVLREAKSAGWYSDLVFFGAGSAVEDVSGSVATMFDASGGQNDVTQGTSSKRPTLDKNAIGGHWALALDGSDDNLTHGNVFIAQPFEQTVVARNSVSNLDDFRYIADNFSNGRGIIGSRGGAYGIYSGSSWLTAGQWDTSPHLLNGLSNGSSSELYLDDSQVNNGDTGSDDKDGLTIGASVDGVNIWAGEISLVIVGPDLTSTERSTLNGIINSFYNIY